MDGGTPALIAYRDLTSKLLHLTVLDETQYPRLVYRSDSSDRAVLGGPQGPTDPLLLTDGRFLRVAVSLFIDRDDDRGPYLKVSKSSFQYQDDAEGERPIFRYDYLREPGPDPHPTAHLQVYGDLHEEDVLPDGMPLSRVHFPTGRISIEAVIRCLVEQFGVPSREETHVWRAALTQTERVFLQVAHTPRSGPAS